MTSASKPLSGPVLPPQNRKVPGPSLSATGAFDALTTIATEVGTYLRLRQQETTKREQIDTYRTNEFEKIHAAERIVTRYVEESFKERAGTIQQLFTRLDEAITSGDAAIVQATLSSVVAIAQTSPIAAAGDFSQIRAALDDSNHKWSF